MRRGFNPVPGAWRLAKAANVVEQKCRGSGAHVGARGGMLARTALREEPTLLPAAVAALARELARDAGPIGCVAIADGVRLESGDRWAFVSAGSDPRTAAMRALKAGACAVLSLDSPIAAVVQAVEAVVARGPQSPIGRTGLVPPQALPGSPGPDATAGAPPRLTAREAEVLALVAQGLSNAEIAATLVISTNTVRTHLHSLALKLEATSRARVVANARALGIREALALPAIAARQLRIPA